MGLLRAIILLNILSLVHPNALRDLLSGLPADFPVPISIVQHLEEGHEESLASWLDRSCRLSVRVAINGDIPKAGDVILGIQGKHLTVKDGVYYFTDEERVNFQKPAQMEQRDV
ncbi:MAG: hypothetical protein B6229_09080 [Spirochaetaceae bacterium 4572_7]|nr:MAG: hypothetical protein B6229_09080 [Spirochaetaceae bacterium 4572_7]